MCDRLQHPAKNTLRDFYLRCFPAASQHIFLRNAIRRVFQTLNGWKAALVLEFTVFALGDFGNQPAGRADRMAHRNFADVERGLLLCSSGEGRCASNAMLE